MLGQLSMIGLPGPVGGFIEADAGDPTKVALYLGQGGTALPDRDYYLKDDPKFAEIRAKYAATSRRSSRWPAGRTPAEDAKAVLALETALAKIQWTQVESRDAVKTYNKMRGGEVVADMPGFDWMAWARPQGIDKAPEWVIGAAVLLQELRGDGADDAARRRGRPGWRRRSSRWTRRS